MKNSIKILAHFNSSFTEERNVLFLRYGVLFFCVVNAIHNVILLEYCWGEYKMSPTLSIGKFSSNFVNLLNEGGTAFAILLIIIQLLCLTGAIFLKYKRILTFIAYFATANLVNSTYLMNSGGHHVILLVLFFLSLINEEHTLDNSWPNAINKAAMIAIKIQVCMIYFISFLYKIIGEIWLDGSALWQALMLDEYTLPIFKEWFASNNYILVFGTYFVLAYQILFPILIWVKKVRKWVLLFGVGLHLFIAFGLGLFTFGIAMIVAYFAFYVPENKIAFKGIRSFID